MRTQSIDAVKSTPGGICQVEEMPGCICGTSYRE